MKIECVKEKIFEAVSKAEKITGKNMSLPVLKCILLEAEKNTLIVRSTNLDLGIEITIPVKVSEGGTVAVPGNILSNFLSHLSNEKSVTLESKDGNLKVSTLKTNTIIKTQPIDDYPSIPHINDSVNFKIPAKDFVKGLKSVWYSSATSSIKPELSSIRIYPNGDSLIFVATDGFRLAEKSVKVKQMPTFSHILIPVKNAIEIIRVFEGIDSDVKISIDQSQMAITSDSSESIYLVSRTVEGNFPDYKTIIPTTTSTDVIVLKQDISNILKLSTVFSDSFNHIKVVVHPKNKEIEFITKNNDVGEHSSRLAGAVTGEELDVNFNYRYINDSFQAIDADSLSFAFSGLNKPLVIRGVGDKSFLYLVMPMNR